MKKHYIANKKLIDRLRRRRFRRKCNRKKYLKLVRRFGSYERDYNNWETVSLKSPKCLTFDIAKPMERGASIDFIQSIVDAPSGHLRKRVFVDLGPCEEISFPAALSLTAAVDVVKIREPGLLNGRDPALELPCAILEAMGFHRHLEMRERDSVLDHEQLAKKLVFSLKSGGLSEATRSRISPASEEIANLIVSEGDSDLSRLILKDRVHQVMNEALLNVVTHAYRSANPKAEQSCLPESEWRWWAVGIFNRVERIFDLIVTDRGVGIPNTLKPELLDLLTSGGSDSARIRLAIKEGRTGRVKGERGGYGLSEMADLISHMPNSHILIESGVGIYARINDEDGLQEIVEQNDVPLPGTMVHWRLCLNG